MHFKAIVTVGAAIAIAALVPGVAGAASTSSAPSLTTADFSCSGSTCTPGPGDVGSAYAATLFATGGPTYFGPECNPYVMTVASGSLPPGLQLVEPDCDWEVIGTPTKAGTFSVTVRIAPQPNSLGQSAGPAGTAQLTIAIGTGSSDRLYATAASWTAEGGKGSSD